MLLDPGKGRRFLFRVEFAQVQRDNQDENLASIRMRKGRRWREEGRAQPDLSYASGGGVRPKGGVWR